MSERDPKRNSISGDVLAKDGSGTRKVTYKGPRNGWHCVVEWERTLSGHRGTCRTIQGWRQWASGASVVNRVETGGN